MTIERDRLLSLIEYSQQYARSRSKSAATITSHGLFVLYEHALQGLPGYRLNVNDPEVADEIWLAVKRLHETRPPDAADPLLQPWVQMAQIPTDEPRLRDAVDGASLIAAGTHCALLEQSGQDESDIDLEASNLPPAESDASDETSGRIAIDPEATITLADYDQGVQVRAQFVIYLDSKWRPWAAEEKRRRQTMKLYSDLFTLKQQLEGSIVEAQIELVWGVGLGIWVFSGKSVSYPLLTKTVELSLNSGTGELEIRPGSGEARIEVDIYAAGDNPNLVHLETAAKDFFEREAEAAFSPFERSSFEPLLRTAVNYLGANGCYWPNQVLPEDRSLPTADDKLKVTDTWVLFARPRSNNLMLQDLEKFKTRAEEEEIDDFPPALAAIITEPDTHTTEQELPVFRGASDSGAAAASSGGNQVRELYFPKPFNDEQIRIVQLLEVHDGVVVQGPPGTGKTHTIANVICHYLATGKRVLVTSMKDPALAVLHQQLPVEIQPLAISLLTSEQSGMKQFEHAIRKIASEVQTLDRQATKRDIQHLEESIDSCHGRLTSIDRKVGEWAQKNLAKLVLGTEEIEPQEAARQVVENGGQFEWIPDALGITAEYEPQFNDEDVRCLREARRILAQDMDYLGASLPQHVEFSTPAELLATHQDLSRLEKLKQGTERGEVPALADSSQETLALAQQLSMQIEELQGLRFAITHDNRPWTAALCDRLRHQHHHSQDDLLTLFATLGSELEEAAVARTAFLTRPVSIPAGIEQDGEITGAVNNLADGRSAFGLRGMFGLSAQKAQLDTIRVLGNVPANTADWQHVAGYMALLKRLRELSLRWNALAHELQLETVAADNPESALVAAQHYALCQKVKSIVKIENELGSAAARIFPAWAYSRAVANDEQRLTELESALRHHLRKNRLAAVWVAKERFQTVLEGRSGRVVNELQRFLDETLGNPDVEDAAMQVAWTVLMTELSRVHNLSAQLDTVYEVCDKIAASAAPLYAAALKGAMNGSVDSLLPGNWRQAWRWKRLAAYLESIDALQQMKKLAMERREVADTLSRAYRDIVVKKTWLKLTENASPSVRAALQAYLNAVLHIGQGTGTRAVRYRQDARKAAEQANPAVPCWIMPHYRVSESLPAQFGCFDLVIIDEASQSDLSALPALLRAKKVLIVGDDKQVSPEGVGLGEEKVLGLMRRFLGNQVETYRAQLSPDRSIYDLFKVVFSTSTVMLKEHFRCVGPIIEYSKREFYNHELQPLRVPKASERLDPPLVDVLVENGYRNGDVNLPEARFIVDEIRLIVTDPAMVQRSIGVVTLLGDKQAMKIWSMLSDELDPELLQRHDIACGDARTFQGKERDIMFLSMVASPNDVRANSGTAFKQRYNVAASRARDRMYLVRSVELSDLSGVDELRRNLIAHFSTPYAQDETRTADVRNLCESDFERKMFDELTQRGYWVTPQVKAGNYRIDMVVEGHNDAKLAVECDGDKYHGPDKWAADMQRQRVLERVGWIFWRCFASAFISRREETLADLLRTLAERGIEPIGAEGAPSSVHTEQRRVTISESERTRVPAVADRIEDISPAPLPELPAEDSPAREDAGFLETDSPPAMIEARTAERAPALVPSVILRDSGLPFSNYVNYSGAPGIDPRKATTYQVLEGLCRIIETEGPMIVKRVHEIYLRSCGIRRMGNELRSMLNRCLYKTVRQGSVTFEEEACETDILTAVVRLKGTPPIRLRSRGDRLFEEIPPSEVLVVARFLEQQHGLEPGSDWHLRMILECFDLKRLTTQTSTTLLNILEQRFTHVDEFLRGRNE